VTGSEKSCHRLALYLSDPLFGPFAKLVSSRARVHVRDERNTWWRVFHMGRKKLRGAFHCVQETEDWNNHSRLIVITKARNEG
jgi:hypothetical protein